MKNFILILLILFVKCGITQEINVDSLNKTLSRDKVTNGKNLELQIRSKKFNLVELNFDNNRFDFSLFKASNNSNENNLGFDHIKGVFIKRDDLIVVFKNATLNDLYRTTKVILIDSKEGKIKSVLSYIDGHLIGISIFKRIESEVVELFCLVSLPIHKNYLKEVAINSLFEVTWAEKQFIKWNDYDSNISYSRIYTESELINAVLK